MKREHKFINTYSNENFYVIIEASDETEYQNKVNEITSAVGKHIEGPLGNNYKEGDTYTKTDIEVTLEDSGEYKDITY